MSDNRVTRLEFEAYRALCAEDHRLAATLFLQAFQEAPDRYHPNRWNCSKNYTDIMEQETFLKSPSSSSIESGIAALTAIMNDKKELHLYRINAAMNVGLLIFNTNKNRLTEAADFMRKAIALSEKVPKPQKRHKVRAVVLDDKGDYCIRSQYMDELIASIVDVCKDWLDGLNYNTNEYQSDIGQIGVPLFGDNQEVLDLENFDFWHHCSVGGEQCDCCEKSREEMDSGKLLLCQRCKKAYYCSKECQRKQWNAGHKNYCREEGQFEPGDIAVLLKCSEDGTSPFVEIVRKDENATHTAWLVKAPGTYEEDPNIKKKWILKDKEGNMTILVAGKYLQQLRPLK